MKRFGRGCKPRPAKSAFCDGAKYRNLGAENEQLPVENQHS